MKTTEENLGAVTGAGLCLVFFGEQWDTECKKQWAILGKATAALDGQVKLLKYDVDMDSGLAEHLRITSIPTLLVFKGGKEVGRMGGFHHENAILKHLEPHMGKNG